MRNKILLLFLMVANLMVAQNITSTTTTVPIDCYLGTATVGVTTDAIAGFNYQLQNQLPGGSWVNAGVLVTINAPVSAFSIANLLASTYRIVLSNLSSLNTDTSANIIINQPFPITLSSINPTPVSCYSGSNGIAALNVYGGTAPLNYSWSNGAPNSATVFGLSFGMYYCDITDANGCVYSGNSIPVIISQPASALTSSLIIQASVSCYGGSDGSATITGVGGTSPYTYLWNNGQTTSNAVGLHAGLFTCTVTDANGCQTTRDVIIVEPSDLLHTTLVNDINCNGGSNGSISVVVTGGVYPYLYSWSNGAVTNVISNLTPGNYICTITDNNGCVKQASGTISQPSTQVVLAVTAIATSCDGGNDGSATASATGGLPPYSYLWSNNNTGNVISGMYSGTYTNYVTDANNCTISQNIFIAEPPPLAATINTTDVSCNGGVDGSATIIPSGGTPSYSYLWGNGQISSIISGLSIGTATCVVTDGNGCILSSSSSVIEPSPIAVNSIITNVSCHLGNDGLIALSVNGGNGSYSYLWSNGQSTSSAAGLTAINTSYIVSVTDIKGCTFTDSYIVTEPSTTLSASTNISSPSCNGGNDGSIIVNIIGGTPPYSYLWNNSNTTQSLYNISTGNYNCTVTDAKGCVAYISETVQQPTALTLPFTTQSVSCFGNSDGFASVNPLGGMLPYTYSWSNGHITSQITALTAGIYTVTVIDANNCLEQQQVTVQQPPQIAATLTPINVLCNGDSTGSITVSLVSGLGNNSYSWSNGITNSIVQNLTADTYYVTITKLNGCSETFSQTIFEPTLISTLITPTDLTVNGANDGTISVLPSGGAPNYSFLWSGPNSYSNTNQNINNLAPGIYNLTVTDANSCQQVFTQVINEPNCNVSINDIYTAPSCYGGLGQLNWINSNGNPPYTNTLQSSNGTQIISGALYASPSTPIQLATGSYQLIVEDASLCSVMSNIVVLAPDSIQIELNTTNVLCFNINSGTASAAIAGGTPPYTYDWLGLIPSQLYAGSYYFTVTDDNNCSNTANYTINQPTQLSIDSVTTTFVSCYPSNDGIATAYASGGIFPYSFLWSNGNTNQTVQNLSSGIYSTQVIDGNGCSNNYPNISITNTTPLNINILDSAISCNNSNNGELHAVVVSGTLPISYTWSDLTSGGVSISTSSSLYNLSPGVYNLSATDAYGCSYSSSSLSIVNPALFNFVLSSNNTTSLNGANDGWFTVDTTVIAGGQYPFTYSWIGSNGYISNNKDISNLTPGTYTLSITDNNGCVAIRSGVITEPVCNVGLIQVVTQPTCFGDNGGVTWNSAGGGLPYTSTITNLVANTVIYLNTNTIDTITLLDGSYSLSIVDSYGCADLLNIQVASPDALTASVNIVDVTCFGGNDGSVIITPQGGTSPYSINYGTSNPNALSASSYNALITDDNGCTTFPSTLLYTIVEPSDISVTPNSTSISCFGGSDGSASVSVTGGTHPYSYQWSPTGETTSIISSLSAGNHYVSITDVNGCIPSSGSSSVIVNQSNLPVGVTFNITQPICYGNANATANAIAYGGTPPYSYLWSDGQTSQLATGLIAGAYYCTVKDSNNCQFIGSTIINQPAEILPNTSLSHISCNGSIDGSALVNPSGGSGVYNIIWFDNTTDTINTALQNGSYHVFVSDNNGCNAVNFPDTFLINQPDSINLSTSVLNNASCSGGSNGSALVTTTGGSLPYSYIWSDSLNVSVSNDSIATSLSLGIYSVIVTDLNGCVESSSITLSSPSLINPNINIDTVTCNGYSDGAATVNPSGGIPPYTFLWSGTTSPLTSSTISGLNANVTYYVSITDSNGCSITGVPVYIPEPAAMSINLTANDYNGYNISCYDSSNAIVTSNVSGGIAPYTYSEDNVSYSSDSISYNNPSGWYILYVKDANSCIQTDSVNLTLPTPIYPNISIFDSLTCNGVNDGTLVAMPQGGASYYSYLWSNQSTSIAISSLSEGSYSVEVMDINSCIGYDTISLLPNISISTVETITNVSCAGGADGSVSLLPFGGYSPYSFVWSNGGISSIALGLSANTYFCTITDSIGCTFVDSVNVTESATSLSINSVQISDVKCSGGNDGFINITVTGGSDSSYTYLWSDSNQQTTSLAANLYADTFFVSVSDSALCTIYDTIIVQEPAVITTSLSIIDVSCNGFSDGKINSQILGGVSPYSVNWLGPNNYSSNSDSLSGLSVGDYYALVTDSNLCSSIDTVTVNEPTPLLFQFTANNPLCYNDLNASIYIAVIGGTTPYNANYMTAIPLYPTTDSIIFSGLEAGIDTLYVSDANGCFLQNLINLTNPLELKIDSLSIVDPSCYNYSDGSALISHSGGTSPFEYKVLDGLNNLIALTSSTSILESGTYTYMIADSNGCIQDTQFSLNNPNEIQIVPTVEDVICFGNSSGSINIEVLNAVSSFQVFWDSITIDTTYIENLESGIYRITIIDDNNCMKVDSVYVNQNEEISFDFSSYDASCKKSEDGAILIYNLYGGLPPYNIYNKGLIHSQSIYDSDTISNLTVSEGDYPYLITVIDDNNCEKSIDVVIDYIGGYNCIDVPVIISPNDDGVNDFWHPIYDIDVDLEVTVINRWGQTEFQYSGNSIIFEWDGLNSNGSKLSSTDYYYIIKFYNKNYPDRTGVITLMR